jgi:hypothetical protein
MAWLHGLRLTGAVQDPCRPDAPSPERLSPTDEGFFASFFLKKEVLF